MDANKRERLEASGFQFGDAEDFLGLSEEDRVVIEHRLAADRAARRSPPGQWPGEDSAALGPGERGA